MDVAPLATPTKRRGGIEGEEERGRENVGRRGRTK